MTKIHYHPDDTTLASYSVGELDPASAIMISVHLEFCHHCRRRVAELEEAQAKAMATTEQAPLTDELSHMLAQIISHPAETGQPEPVTESGDIQLQVNNKTFHLPRVFRNHQQQIGPWNRLPGNIQRAHIKTGDHSKMNFIYMDSHSALPQHTHQGNEVTLVLSGEFSDEQATYQAGDFVLLTGEHTHTPRTSPGQDCLCLTLLDAPLRFTSGLATLLNPFSPLFFR